MGMLEQLEERVQSLEQLVYRSAGRTGLDVDLTVESVEDQPSGQVEFQMVTTEELEMMSNTEMVQFANQQGIMVDRFMPREDIVHCIMNQEQVEDRIRNIREDIAHFINVIQPSLKQVLQCSKRCVDKCPAIQVVDCWNSNREKIQEV
jgi:hypothetical protein